MRSPVEAHLVGHRRMQSWWACKGPRRARCGSLFRHYRRPLAAMRGKVLKPPCMPPLQVLQVRLNDQRTGTPLGTPPPWWRAPSAPSPPTHTHPTTPRTLVHGKRAASLLPDAVCRRGRRRAEQRVIPLQQPAHLPLDEGAHLGCGEREAQVSRQAVWVHMKNQRLGQCASGWTLPLRVKCRHEGQPRRHASVCSACTPVALACSKHRSSRPTGHRCPSGCGAKPGAATQLDEA
jgi:hypothetical protein